MGPTKIAIVGAGIGGLATASALSHKGFDVHERNSRDGGLVYDSGDRPERDAKQRDTVANLLWSLDYDVEAAAQSLLATAGS